MCFSNLPIEFDAEGNPSLADDAEDVERPDVGPTSDAELGADPESAYEAIVESLPEGARGHVEGHPDRQTSPPDPDVAEGD